jgi:outer membrane protein OmpA-like peptidoglycan-associated protein
LLGWGRGGGLAFLLPILLPVDIAYRNDGLRFEPRLAASRVIGRFTLDVNAGYRLHAAEGSLGIHSGNFVTGGAGAVLRVTELWSALGELTAHWSPDDRTFTDSHGLASEARLALRYGSVGWGAQLGAGRGLLRAALDPDWRMLASMSFTPNARDDAPAPPAPPAPPSSDAADDDYLSPAPDWQPLAAAEATPPPAVEGAAVPPQDPNAADAPLVSEEPAPATDDPPSVAPDRLVLHFAQNQARLDESQYPLLAPLVEQMRNLPFETQLMVEGHSDNSGAQALNWSLSLERAMSVRYQLIRAGLDWRRVGARAYGPSRPLAPDTTPETQAQNRRVQFRLVHARRPGGAEPGASEPSEMIPRDDQTHGADPAP